MAFRNSFRATGPWVYKNFRFCGSISAPGFAEPTFPMRIDGGRMICAPTGFRWTVGAAISHPKAFSLLGRRCRAYARRMRVGAGMAKALQRAGQCPAPTKGEKRFYIRRRGGCPHPPALEGTPFVGHGLPDAPFRLPAKRRRGGTLGRPPYPAAQLEPRHNKGAFKKGSARFSTTARPAAAKDEGKAVS